MGHFPEILMKYFEISDWYNDSVKIEVGLDESNSLLSSLLF